MKARANVSIDKTLLEAARNHGVVLSTLFEEALRKHLSDENERTWKKENQKKIEAYNAHIDEHGVFSDGIRRF